MPTDPELPKFDALRDFLDAQTGVPEHIKTPVKTWIDKLEEWSKDRLTEKGQLEAQLRGYEEGHDEIVADMETWLSLQEWCHDVRLGIRTTEEFFEEWAADPLAGVRPDGGKTEKYGDPWPQ